MALLRGFIAAAVSLAALAPSLAYTWPNPKLDALESLRYDQTGFNGDQIAALINPCDSFIFGKFRGRTNVGDWVRTVRNSCRVLSAVG
jgi:hypothetical protein